MEMHNEPRVPTIHLGCTQCDTHVWVEEEMTDRLALLLCPLCGGKLVVVYEMED